MEFEDLNSEIGAGDWIISREDITWRRLIKQTPRFNIYKADWFGDVLIYEPATVRQQHLSQRISQATKVKHLKNTSEEQDTHQDEDATFDREQFRARLDELCLSTRKQEDQMSESRFENSDLGADSAYSSISSSPQYHTKHNLEHEFQFPSQLCDPLAITCDTRQEMKQQQSSTLESSEKEVSQKPSSATSPPVVLNRDSFSFDFTTADAVDYAIDGNKENSNYALGCHSSMSTTPTTSASSWFELNELRLVAHENFMLFMGASIEESATFSDNMEQTKTSLVMQMSHPKSISLHNLLHASNSTGIRSPTTGPLSPIDR